LINSYIFKDLVGQKGQDKFYQWSDSRQDFFGLNFMDISDADNFIEKMNFCVNALKNLQPLNNSQTEKNSKDSNDTNRN